MQLNLIKKTSKAKNSESGSIVILGLLLISAILGFVVFCVDLSNNFLAYSNTELINDISALSGANLYYEGLTLEESKTSAKLIALANYEINSGLSWRGDDKDVSAELLPVGNNRMQVKVSRKRPYMSWFSGIFGKSNLEEYEQHSFAAIDTEDPDNTKPVHLILMTDMNSAIYHHEIMPYIYPKELGSEFSKEILNQLTDTDYFTWITYTIAAKVIFNKIPATTLNKQLITEEYERRYTSYVEHSAMDNPEYNFNDSFDKQFKTFESEHATAFIAARAVLEDAPIEEREALVLLSDANITDYEYYLRLLNMYYAHLFSDESWYNFNEEEAAQLRQDCNVRIMTLWDMMKIINGPQEGIPFINAFTEPGIGEELSGVIIKNLQLNRDLRVYTVSTKQHSPDLGEGKNNYANPGYSHNYHIYIADDPSIAFGKISNRLKCSPNRPLDKQGMYFPYSKDWKGTARKLTHHARYAPYTEQYPSYYSKPTLVSGF